MLARHIQRIPEFAQLPVAQRSALLQQVQVLCIPRGRWLVRKGRNLEAFFYLLKGKLECFTPNHRHVAKTSGPLHHFYPGCDEVRALSAVHVLRVDAQLHSFAGAGQSLTLPCTVASEPWLERFLNSHMMRQLPKQHWRALWMGLSSRSIAPGEQILMLGTPGEHCFVIETGHAVVHRHGQTLCHLGPGDFFGEDALVSNRLRNANVSALDHVRMHAIHKTVFADLLLAELVRFVSRCSEGELLTLDPNGPGRRVTLDGIRAVACELDPGLTYYVQGGRRNDRALAALLLIQRGLRAFPLDQAGTVRSCAQSRSD
jgi:CRP-like cAMP-binding protein